MRRLGWLPLVALAGAVGACQLFGGLGGLEFVGKRGLGGSGGTASGTGGGTGGTGSPTSSTGTVVSVGSMSTTTSTSSSTGSSGLDPELDLPDPSGKKCTHYGTSSDCSGECCRIDGKDFGRCEGCDTNGGCAGVGKPCSSSFDCDILFQCFRGECTAPCQLGTTECGPVNDCIDVGNDTEGVCWPPLPN